MIVFLPASLCLAALVVHSLWVRGPSTTARFFLSCLGVFELKGLADINNPSLDYVPQIRFLESNGLNYGVFFILLPIGWTFAHYCALCLAEAVLSTSPSRAERFLPLNGLSVFIVGLIGLCMEGANRSAGWWLWREGARESFLAYLFVWWLRAAGFFPFFLINYLDVKCKVRLEAWSIAYLVCFFLVLAAILSFLGGVGVAALLAVALAMQALAFYKGGPKLKSIRKPARTFRTSKS